MNKRKIGNTYEEEALKFLSEYYKVIEKNYRNSSGEIDLICLDEASKIIIFVEVKFRKNKTYGYGYEAIDKKKIKKIFEVAEQYLTEKKEYENYKVRFDCISYLGEKLEWIKDIVWGDEIGF